MKRILTGIQVAQGERLPNWYGVAYREFCADHVICYPIPINLLVRWHHGLKWLVKKDKASALQVAYSAGFAAGRQEFLSREAREERRCANVINLLQK